MRKWNLALVIVLLIQIALVIVMYTRQPAAQAAPAGPWVTIDQATLGKVVIADGKGKSVTLKHGSGGWVVPAESDFPADHGKLTSLVAKLNGARPDLPLAVSKDAWARFHVAPKQFDRKLTFVGTKGHKTIVYLGSSAGAGRVYARRSGRKAVEDIAFPLWQASTDASDWLDKSYLNVAVHNAQKIVLPHVTLTQDDGLWGVTDLATGRITDHEKVATVIDGLAGLTWDKLVGERGKVKLPSAPTLTLSVTPAKGKVVTYDFYERPGKPEAASKSGGKPSSTKKAPKPTWWVSRPDGHFVLSVNDDSVEPLLKASTASLSQPKSKPSSKPAGSASAAAPAVATSTATTG